MKLEPEEEIIAILGEPTVKGGKSASAYGYLQAWRRQGGQMSVTPISWRIKKRLGATYKECDLLKSGPQRLLIQVKDFGQGIKSIQINALLGDFEDKEMANFATTLGKPVKVSDEILGTLQLKPPDNIEFIGVVRLNDSDIDLSLPTLEREPAPQALLTLRTLVTEWEARQSEILSKIARQMNTEKYSAWWDHLESPKNHSDFIAKLQIHAISIARDSDNYTIWLTDGGWFAGHGINIAGSISGGLGDARMG